MIIYDLRCANEHAFEGWFHSASDFEQQVSRHLINCPQCESLDVRRVPSAVAIGNKAAAHPQASSGIAVRPSGTEMVANYRQLVRTLIANSEDVGEQFAEEARKIHYEEAPDRAICGQASDDDLASLADEGIAVISLPKLRVEDLN
jgi:hypothetical protein